jgi:hypothetical protein|eukprot:SAG25_NODE_352_length_9272_cov_9.627385_5_plen_462_part_00
MAKPMSVQEMRKVMNGFNHQMRDGVTDETKRRMQRDIDALEPSRRRGHEDGEEQGETGAVYEDDGSSFEPSRVRGSRSVSGERAYLRSLPEEDDEFDEQVSDAVRQYRRGRQGAPSKYSAPAKMGRRRGRGESYMQPTKAASRRGQRGGSSAPTTGRGSSAGTGSRRGPYWHGGADSDIGPPPRRKTISETDERRRTQRARREARVERSEPSFGGRSRGRGGLGGDDGGGDIERHKQRVEELKNQVKKLQADIPNLMKDYERQRRGKEDTDRKLQSLERQLKERTKELSIRNADNLALKKENEELVRANEDWKRRYEGKERELATQQKAVIKLQYLVEWYMSREQRFKAVSRAEMEELVEEQSHGQKQMEAMDKKLKNGLMNKMEHQQRTYAGFVESVRKQTHMLKKKEDEVKRLRSGLIEKERFLMEQDKLNESLSKELLSNSMDVYKKTVKTYLDKTAH